MMGIEDNYLPYTTLFRTNTSQNCHLLLRHSKSHHFWGLCVQKGQWLSSCQILDENVNFVKVMFAFCAMLPPIVQKIWKKRVKEQTPAPLAGKSRFSSHFSSADAILSAVGEQICTLRRTRKLAETAFADSKKKLNKSTISFLMIPVGCSSFKETLE